MKIEATEIYPADKAVVAVESDGSGLAIQFTLSDGKPISMGISRATAESLIHQLTMVGSVSIDKNPATGAPGFVRATPVSEAAANATDEPGKVIVCFLNERRVAHYFALTAETSAQLRPQLRNAESASRQGVKLPRA